MTTNLQRIFGHVSVLALAAGLIGASTMASAQEADTEANGDRNDRSVSEEDGDSIPTNSNEIIVTAQFRAQSLQDTPLSITAVNAEMLEARSQADIEDVANRAPNVMLSHAAAGVGGSQTVNVTIRGIGQDDFNLAVEPGVGIYIDEVYYGTSYGSLFDLMDLDRVEILRGPQGTLAGKNSVGGAIKLFSKQPSADQDAFAEVTVGSFDRRQLRGGFNFTVVPDAVYVRITGLAETRDGYVTRYDYACHTGRAPDALGNIPSRAKGGEDSCVLGTEGGENVLGLRAAVRVEPTDWLDNTLTVDTTRERSDPTPRVLTFQGDWNGPGYNFLGPPGPNPVESFVTPDGSFYNYANYCALYATNSLYCQNAESNLDAWGVTNILNVDLGDNLSLKSISAVRKLAQDSATDTDGSPVSREVQYWAVDYTQYSQELRVNGSLGDNAFWTVGGFYFESDARQGGRINLDGVAGTAPFYIPIDFTFNDPVTTRSASAFAHLEVEPVERLTLTGGIRYTDDYKRLEFERDWAPGYTPGPVDQGIVATSGAVGVFEGTRVDYRVTGSYEITPDVNVYAQFATGYKGGGVNPRPYYQLQVQPFGPETTKSYEIGLKSALFGRSVRFNASAFLNQYDDIQLTLFSCPHLIPPGQPPFCYLPANVGDAEIRGLELETEVRLPGDTLLDVSASYLDFQYKSVAPSTGVRLSDKPPFVPEFKFALGVQKEFQFRSGSLTPRLDYQYQTEQWVEPINLPNGRIPGYGLANGRLTYETANEEWQLSLSVTNIFDKYYSLTISDATIPSSTTDNYRVVIPGRPREWSLQLKKHF